MGIVAWGIECGQKDVPGAYASIESGLCFIKWATQCVHGFKYWDYLPIGNCENFIKDEIDNLTKLRDEQLTGKLMNK